MLRVCGGGGGDSDRVLWKEVVDRFLNSADTDGGVGCVRCGPWDRPHLRAWDRTPGFILTDILVFAEEVEGDTVERFHLGCELYVRL